MKIIYDGSMDPRQAKAVFSEVIPDMAEKDPDFIYLDADLMSCIGTLSWAKAHPERAINCGIAESNMVGVACGLAAAGFKPLIHSFAPFVSRRVFDQVYLSAAYAKNDITVLGTDPGVTAALNGGTHMPFEDLALYRTIPTATIFEPTDMVQLEDVLRQCPDLPGVKYIRVGRKDLPKIYEAGSHFSPGQAVVVREGKDITILAAGIMMHEALKAADALAGEGILAEVIDPVSIKPLDEETLAASVKKTGALLVAENHNQNGGLFDAAAAVLAKKAPVPAAQVAVEDEFGEVGPQKYLQERFGLTAEHIIQKARELVKLKK